jgi:hypothetical protein
LNTVSDGTNNFTILTPSSSTLEKTWVAYRYYASGLASSSTITATFAASQSERMIGAISFLGVADTSPLHVENQRNQIVNETSWSGATVTTSQPNTVVMGFTATSGAGTPTNTAGTNYTEGMDWAVAGAQKSAAMVYRIVATSAAHQPLGTWSASQTGAEQSHITAAFLEGAPTAQTARPTADSVDGNWLNEASSGTNLYQSIDETTPSDTDYIQSEAGPANSAVRLKIGSLTDPVSSTGHVIRWRTGKDSTGGATINMTVKLYQGGGNTVGGGTLIASFSRNAVDALTTYEETLSGGQADTITDYTDLFIEFAANQV